MRTHLAKYFLKWWQEALIALDVSIGYRKWDYLYWERVCRGRGWLGVAPWSVPWRGPWRMTGSAGCAGRLLELRSSNLFLYFSLCFFLSLLGVAPGSDPGGSREAPVALDVSVEYGIRIYFYIPLFASLSLCSASHPDLDPGGWRKEPRSLRRALDVDSPMLLGKRKFFLCFFLSWGFARPPSDPGGFLKKVVKHVNVIKNGPVFEPQKRIQNLQIQRWQSGTKRELKNRRSWKFWARNIPQKTSFTRWYQVLRYTSTNIYIHKQLYIYIYYLCTSICIRMYVSLQHGQILWKCY